MSEATPTGFLPELPDTSGITKVFDTISDGGFWKRFGVIAIGTALVIIGTVVMVSGTKAVKQATSLAVGAASKIVTKGVV